MPSPFLDAFNKTVSSDPLRPSSPFLSAFNRPKTARKRKSLDELREEVSLLEQEQAAYGAPSIEQEKPGAFRTVVDLISRPNYAVAGATEELLNGRSVSSAVGRALSEIFSGLGPIEGQKRAFGQVLEGQGVGTKTLADAIPALEGTWVGHMGSRGAAGLALDILLDPLTYLTGGAARGALKILGPTGKELALSAKGMEEFNTILRSTEVADELAGLSKKVADPFMAGRSGLEIKKFELAEKAFARKFGEQIPKELLDPGGLRWMGQTVVRGETFADMNANVAKAIRMMPGGDYTLTRVGEFSKKMERGINELFGPLGHLTELPPEMRAAAIRLKRNFNNATGLHRQRVRGILEHGNNDLGIEPQLARRWVKAQKADPDLGKKFYDLREGTGVHALTTEQQQMFDEFSKLYDSMGQTLVDAGVFEKLELVDTRYFHHSYTRESLKGLDQYHANLGTKFTGEIKETITKERPFKTYREADEVSRRMNALQTDLYPILEPEYDVLLNMNKYIDQYADSIARKGWHEEAVAKFGVDPKLFDKNVHWAETTGRVLPDRDAAIIREVVGGATDDAGLTGAAATIRRGLLRVADADTDRALLRNARGFSKQDTEIGHAIANKLRSGDDLSRSEWSVANSLYKKYKRQIGDIGKESSGDLLEKATNALPKLSGEGKAELLGHMIEGAKTPAETIDVVLFADRTGLNDYLPKMTVEAGEMSAPMYQKLYGDSGRLVRRSGALWGDREVMIPEIIAKDIEGINSTIFNTKDWKAFRAVVDKYDRANNFFKVGNYTIFPASHIRNVYSNIMQSGLDIGAGAINPKMNMEAIAIMAGKELDKVSVGGYTRGALRQMFRDYGVWVPGRTFVEATGKRRLGRMAGKAADVTGMVENEARILLALQNVNRGIHPRQAADHVGEFLFHYNELSRFERDVMRRIFPFYTWTRKAIPLQVAALKRTPGRLVNQLKAFRGINDENEQMIQWEAEGLKMRMDKDGKTVKMLTGIDLPIRSLDTLWRGTPGKTGRSIVGMSSPILKTIPEVLLNHDFFLGRDLTRIQSNAVGSLVDKMPTPQGVKDWLGYKKTVDDAGRPRYTFDGRKFTLLFRSWVFSRAISTSDRQFRENMDAGGVQWQRMALDVMTGLRVKSVNLDEQMQRRLSSRVRQLEEALHRRGAREEFGRRYKPKDFTAGQLR